jgi:hypothetical protein
MRAAMAAAVRSSHEFEAGDLQQALRSFSEVRGRLDGLQLTSGWAEWGTAACLDNLGELTMAFDKIQNSLRLDPLSPTSVRSFELIAQRLRDAVTSASPTDPSVPKLYELLRRAGEANVPTHLAMVRHLCATGDLERAASLAEAVTTLSPVCRDAWRVRADVARRRGDDTSAATFEAEALVRELEDVPFAPAAKKGPVE